MSTGPQPQRGQKPGSALGPVKTVNGYNGGGMAAGEHQVEIQLGHVCNNRCVFCSSGQLSERGAARPVPLEALIEAIEDARGRGATRITFLGGEPTLHKDLVRAMRHAAAVGFEDMVVFTNGTSLTRPGLIDEVSAIGRIEWRVSIQGGDEEAHGAVTRRKRAFSLLVDGLRMLKARRQKVTANLCASEQNYRSLPLLPRLLREHDVVHAHVDMIRPSSTGDRTEDELRALMPRYSDMAPYLAHMLAEAERIAPPVDVSIGNLPFCVLSEWSHRVHHGGEATVTRASDEAGLEDAVDKYAWHASMRRHLSRCDGCALRDRCAGVLDVYLALHGEEEIWPISRTPLPLETRACASSTG